MNGQQHWNLIVARKHRGATRNNIGHGPSQRQLRVGELVRHALSEILLREDLHDPDLKDVNITVAEVRPTPDLKRATCYVMPLGGHNPQTIVKALARIAPKLSYEVGKRVKLKFTPRLLFQTDQTFGEAARMDELLRSPKVAADLARDEDDDIEGGGNGA
jgi:ribosome-binding factor A